LSQTSLPDGATPLLLADLNGDGRLDVAAGNLRSVSVLLGDGVGNFSLSDNDVLGTGYLLDIEHGDFNGDGKQDLVVSSQTPPAVWLLTGAGDGTFTPTELSSLSYDPGDWPRGVEVRDFDGDGHLDIALNASNAVQLLYGHGDGTFDPPLVIAIAARNAVWLVSADFNQDGRLDLVLGTAGTTRTYLGGANRTFTEVLATSPCSAGKWLVHSDLNGDGKEDLVGVGNYGSTVFACPGNGDGTFQSGPSFAYQSGNGAAFLADVSGDGRADLIVNARNPEHLDVYLGLGNGSFSARAELPPQAPGRAVAVGEVTGDSNVDLLVGTDIGFFVFAGQGGGSFQTPTPPPLASAGGIGALAVADFDGDGHPDVAATPLFVSSAELPVSVMLGSASGLPHEPAFTAVKVGAAMVPADLDGDAKVDLIALRSTSVESWTSAWPGKPLPTSNLPLPDVGHEAVAADFDADGRSDVAIITDGVTRLVVAHTRADATLELVSTTSLWPPVTRSRLAAGDVDGDSKMDLVVTFDDKLMVLAGNGDLTFRQLPEISIAPARDLALAELNGDGKLDAVIVDESTGALNVLLGKGDGTFQPLVVYPAVAGRVVISDQTLDGIPDLITFTPGTARLELRAGVGDGTFAAPVALKSNLQINDAVAADLNGDGRTDLVFGGAKGLNVLLNASCGP
jgi:hypothetical protein